MPLRDRQLHLAKLDVVLLAAPIETPHRNAFGVQTSRPAVLVRLEDRDGAHGWGEVFANWPPGGAALGRFASAHVLAAVGGGGYLEVDNLVCEIGGFGAVN